MQNETSEQTLIAGVILGFFGAAAIGSLIFVFFVLGENFWNADTSATLRNFALIIVGIVGIGLGAWRAQTADQQSKIARGQLAVTQAGHNIDRAQKGIEFLQSDNEATQMAGIQTLRELAIADPQNHFRFVIEQLCVFARMASRERASEEQRALEVYPERTGALRADDLAPSVPADRPVSEALIAAFVAIGEIHSDTRARAEARLPPYWNPDLRDLCLKNVTIIGGKFSDLLVQGSNFAGAKFLLCDIQSSRFAECNFEGVHFDAVTINLCEFAASAFEYIKAVDGTMRHCKFSNCKFSSGRFKSIDFEEILFEESRFGPNDFKKCEFNSIEFYKSYALPGGMISGLPDHLMKSLKAE